MNTLATLIWPPSGLAVAALLIGGLQLWPAVAIGAFFVNAATGVSWTVLPAITVGNTLEAIAAVYYLRKCGFRTRLQRVVDVTLLCLIGVALSPIIAATVGVGSLWFAGILEPGSFLMTWGTWYLGDAIGILVLTPAILVWSGYVHQPKSWSRLMEAGALAISFLGVSIFAYFRLGEGADPATYFLVRPYSLFPFLVWAAVRFGQWGATACILSISIISLLSILLGPGPIAVGTLRENLIFSQYFLAFAGFTAFVLAASTQVQRSAQRALSRAKEKADEANRAKSEFVANMSHEIRTPLSIVIGYCDFLLKPELDRAERLEYAQTIKRSGEVLLKLVGDILDISRIEAGRLQIEKTGFPLDDFLEQLHSLFRLKAEQKGIRFVFEKIGPVADFVVSDSARLQQILTNVIGNAFKFTHEGIISMQIRSVRSEDGAPLLEFAVTDSGCGIYPHQVPRLFGRFSQADGATTTRRFGGSGLGLGLSRTLAQLLGGDLVLKESTPGRGSTFVVTVSNSALLPAPIQKAKRSPTSPLPSLERVSVLLAEDAPDNRLLATRLLEAAGAKVDVAENGAVAVNKALSRDYDVILMDLQMPGLDGYEATHFLRANRFSRPIIALTADAFSDSRERCLHSGFSAHLTKPINPALLVQTIQSCMNGG